MATRRLMVLETPEDRLSEFMMPLSQLRHEVGEGVHTGLEVSQGQKEP